ncbi:HlyD family secretion protein [Pectinatus frisingensis]|uniref:HlyD family secretion protein n=1 Tax=Pectinatus frisingensis TaxID=865 RepID=UPI0015F67EE7|nr:efflux RND transporter periplasmic adaptor subunit [Pectinatus frisingensis]
MEVDISHKVIPIIKFTLPIIVLIAVILNICIWLYGQYHAYITFYDVRVTGSFLQTKTLTDGTLEKLLVADGQSVTAGQPLAQIHPNITQKDIDNLQQAVDQAQQQYDNMVSLSKQTSTKTISTPQASAPAAVDDSQYQNALAQESKMKQLYDIGAVSRSEYEQAAAAVESAKATLNPSSSSGTPSATTSVVAVPSGVTQEDIQTALTRLNQTKLALEDAQKNTDTTELYASADGTVYYTGVKEGDNISAGQNILDIATSNYIWLEAKAPEEQAVKLKEGAYAECKVNGKIIGGTVVQIIDPASDEKNYTVKIFIPSDKMNGIKPNMIATAKISIGK